MCRSSQPDAGPAALLRRSSQHRMRRGRFGVVPFLFALFQLAVAPGIDAQEGLLQPRLHEPALWSPHHATAPAEAGRIQVQEAERTRPFLAMAGASTLGSLVGAGAGVLVGTGSTHSMVGIIFGFPGAWLGSAVGADLAGADLPRALLGSTVGLVAGAAVLGWGGEGWGWTGFAVHGLVTSLLAGGVR
jgi:hypothetical protein